MMVVLVVVPMVVLLAALVVAVFKLILNLSISNSFHIHSSQTFCQPFILNLL